MPERVRVERGRDNGLRNTEWSLPLGEGQQLGECTAADPVCTAVKNGFAPQGHGIVYNIGFFVRNKITSHAPQGHGRVYNIGFFVKNKKRF